MSEEMYESSQLAQLVESQWKKWLLLTKPKPPQKPQALFPTITISRERGSGGGLIGHLVAERLGFVMLDSEIVDHVAKSAAVDRMIVAHMDEQSQRSVEHWTSKVLHNQKFTALSYMGHLAKAIVAAGEKGRAVIVGRGAHLLLPSERCLRVRTIAPLEVRVARLCSTGLERAAAESIIKDTDAQRSQFIRDNFQESDANPMLYDLVINTAGITLETAADLIVRAAEAKFPQILEARLASV
ncbi:MAG: hypothetical protein A3F68_01900 [Acidobacteria bacterium RIFCSPLOWO2_12_FULL_54_10]|nr:MAG: hypothetical protein A3F68_01900 [Acidobacteria bacterium RIFCSPLOWO2_12_FULL_54_10]